MSIKRHVSIAFDKHDNLAHWKTLMRNFCEENKVKCESESIDVSYAPQSMSQFSTGSRHDGMRDVLGMSGFGTYTLPNGVIYKGEFYDGMFHGPGEMRYPNGAILRGKWKRGQVTERVLIFADGLKYSETDWEYSRIPDRRFTIEYKNGLQPAGKSYFTADPPTRRVPTGYYDTGDGFYDPETKVVYAAEDITAIIRSPSVREQKWIIDNCRMSCDPPLGPRKDLYEEWSEPQVDPQPPPHLAASPHTGLSQSFQDDLDQDYFFEMLRKSRTSQTIDTNRYSIGSVKSIKGQRFRWQD